MPLHLPGGSIDLAGVVLILPYTHVALLPTLYFPFTIKLAAAGIDPFRCSAMYSLVIPLIMLSLLFV